MWCGEGKHTHKMFERNNAWLVFFLALWIMIHVHDAWGYGSVFKVNSFPGPVADASSFRGSVVLQCPFPQAQRDVLFWTDQYLYYLLPNVTTPVAYHSIPQNWTFGVMVLSHYGDAEEPDSCDALYVYVVPDNDPLSFHEIQIRGEGFRFQPTNLTVNFTIPNCNGSQVSTGMYWQKTAYTPDFAQAFLLAHDCVVSVAINSTTHNSTLLVTSDLPVEDNQVPSYGTVTTASLGPCSGHLCSVYMVREQRQCEAGLCHGQVIAISYATGMGNNFPTLINIYSVLNALVPVSAFWVGPDGTQFWAQDSIAHEVLGFAPTSNLPTPVPTNNTGGWAPSVGVHLEACHYAVYAVPWDPYSPNNGFNLFPVAVGQQPGCPMRQWADAEGIGGSPPPQHHITFGNVDIFGYSPVQGVRKGFAAVYSSLSVGSPPRQRSSVWWSDVMGPWTGKDCTRDPACRSPASPTKRCTGCSARSCCCVHNYDYSGIECCTGGACWNDIHNQTCPLPVCS